MTTLKRIYKWLFNPMPPIDQTMVNEFLATLNADQTVPAGTPPVWIELEGGNVLTKYDLNASGQVVFQANAGYLVKGFLNTRTGEVKLFSVQRFVRR